MTCLVSQQVPAG